MTQRKPIPFRGGRMSHADISYNPNKGKLSHHQTARIIVNVLYII